jgi:hypothetical protein
MSRGLGSEQRWLFRLIKKNPLITFAGIVEQTKGDDPRNFVPHVIRSWRRALRKMVDQGAIMTAGLGGPREPHRYYVDPVILAMADNQEAFERVRKALEDYEASRVEALDTVDMPPAES